MKGLICAASVVFVLAMAGLTAGPVGASSDDETPSIKKIMETLHKGPKSPLSTVKAALKKAAPDWTEIQKQAEEFAKYGESLPKNDPPKGKKASYEKLAKAFAANTKTLKESAEREDLKATKSAFNKISSSCTACHKSHRPN
jgi:fructose-specific component phosphotransferase system IIB-like protein